jgi:hypothetical protein
VTATNVGICEFRAGLADYIDADAPVGVIRHGQAAGYFIPTKSDRQADLAALQPAAAKLDELLRLDESGVDAAVNDFRQLRRRANKKCSGRRAPPGTRRQHPHPRHARPPRPPAHRRQRPHASVFALEVAFDDARQYLPSIVVEEGEEATQQRRRPSWFSRSYVVRSTRSRETPTTPTARMPCRGSSFETRTTGRSSPRR